MDLISIVTTPSRRILQIAVNDDTFSPETTAGNSKEPPLTPSTAANFNRTTSAFDSSMALTVLVMLTALFFIGFFSIYLRHFAGAGDGVRRRNPSQTFGYRPGGGGKGLDPAAVRALPAVAYGGGAPAAAEECIICLSEFELKEIVKIIPYCGHVFHATCIDTWLSSHASCPLCRSTQFFKSVDEFRLDLPPPQPAVVVEDSGGGGSAVNGGEDVGSTQMMRRVCSCSNLGNHVMLHRSNSF